MPPGPTERLGEWVNEHYTLGEEIAHSVTHGVGAALSVAALVTLLVLAILRGTPWHILSFTVYGVSLRRSITASRSRVCGRSCARSTTPASTCSLPERTHRSC